MEIILLQDVEKLGEKNDVVTVKNGYALNFLIPQGMAMVATPSQKKQLAENLRQAAHRLEKLKTAALQQAQQLEKLSLSIPMLVGKDGKVYGSVSSVTIGNALKDAGFDIDRKKITLPADAERPGSFVATVNLHKEVKAQVPFTIVEKQPE
ncbi:MAG: 50S ribosomal protein L9 [Bacteroidia bacterium]|nr:50S ribosomal protein L9 [Bacteroidia bacterium]